MSAISELQARARHERRCHCRGYGWCSLAGAIPVGDCAAARALVCACAAGRRLWSLALTDPDWVAHRMGLDEHGNIAHPSGLYGFFSINGPDYLRELCEQQ